MKSKSYVLILMLAFSVQSKDTFTIPQSLLNQVDSGNAEVAYFIAKSYLDGSETFAIDLDKAMTWLEKAANMGYAHAMHELADEYHKKDKTKQALTWYLKAADEGVADAFGAVANYYLVGEGGLEKDCNIAYEWYEKAEVRDLKLAFNNHAWYLATTKDKKCRNSEKALVVYMKMKALYVSQDSPIPWGYWDTEAAVLASISDFSGAIKLQTWLVEEMQSNDFDTSTYQLHLDQYLLRKPWRE